MKSSTFTVTDSLLLMLPKDIFGGDPIPRLNLLYRFEVGLEYVSNFTDNKFSTRDVNRQLSCRKGKVQGVQNVQGVFIFL